MDEDKGHTTERARLAKGTQNRQTRTTKSPLCDKHFYTCGVKPHGWQGKQEDTRSEHETGKYLSKVRQGYVQKYLLPQSWMKQV